MDLDPQVNIPLLRKTVEWAEAEHAKGFSRSQWYQDDYICNYSEVYSSDHQNNDLGFYANSSKNVKGFMVKEKECGTCYCIAGKIAVDNLPLSATLEYNWHITLEDATNTNVEDFATSELGISTTDRLRLFAAGNTIGQIREIAEDIAGERL